MKKLFIFILVILAVNGALADNSKDAAQVDPHYLLSAQDCQEMKQGIGFFLGVAD